MYSKQENYEQICYFLYGGFEKQLKYKKYLIARNLYKEVNAHCKRYLVTCGKSLPSPFGSGNMWSVMVTNAQVHVEHTICLLLSIDDFWGSPIPLTLQHFPCFKFNVSSHLLITVQCLWTVLYAFYILKILFPTGPPFWNTVTNFKAKQCLLQ